MDPRSSGTGAYGSAGATGQFDVMKFITKPQVIIRVVGAVCAIIVFACIGHKGWEMNKCFNSADVSVGVCNYGTGIGVTALILLLGFLVLDAMFDNLSNIQQRKYIVIGDMICSGLMSFLWFVAFCYTADGLRRARAGGADVNSDIEAAVAFSFFSTAVFVGLTVMAVLRYRRGVSDMSVYGDGSDMYTDGGGSPF